jgi:hypothetical protein
MILCGLSANLSLPDYGRVARYPGTFKEDRLEERLSRTSSKTTPKPPMRAVDTLNLLAHETLAVGQGPLALISAV